VQQAGIGTINIVDSTPIALAVTYPDAYSATLTTTLDTQAAATVFAGPETGADTAPTFRAIVPSDLPDATASTKGIMQPGTGLAVDTGTLNHSNTVSGTTISSITFDDQGHITAAVPLVAADIPDLDVSKITTGEFSTVRYADASITASKIADYANAQIGETLPVADHIGQFFFNPLEGSVYLWDGNVWQPVGVTTGAIAFAGTFDASAPSGIGQVATVTSAGAAVGLVAGSGLPAASLENSEYYLVVSSGGTITTGNAPFRTLAPPDLILSDGTAWVEVDVSTGAGAIAATNVSFSSGGDISATSVQSAIEEVSTECRNADNITSGTLAVARGGTGLASYAKGDLIAASGATTLAKLPVGTNTHVLRANSSTATGLEWGADFTGTVTDVTSSTTALTVATSTTTPALTIRSATTSVNGIVQLSDSTSTTSSILAATPTAVKSAYDLAALALPKAGGTVTGDITLGTNVGIQFEGTTDDANEIRLIGADATADRTITLPNVTGTVITTGDVDTVTGTIIASGTIVNANINNSAAIAYSKLALSSGIVNTDIGASAAIALSKLATGALPTGITIASGNIVDGTITNADINASAGIVYSKLALSSGIVNTDISASAAIALSKLATGALPTGITVSSGNIVDGTITNADINASAAIVDTKLATIATAGKVSNSATTATNANTASAIVARDASGNFSAGTITASLIGTASNVTTNANLTGDVTSVGNATAIAAGAIVNADINASAGIALSKLATGALPSAITIASANIVDGSIVNADINASAAIVDTKLATISTAGKVSGTAITSGTIATSGQLTITNTSPIVVLAESDGTATHSQTALGKTADQFVIQTRSSTGVFLSSDYVISADASGATSHSWRIAGAEKALLNSSGLTVVDDLTISDKIIHAGDTNTAIRFPAADTIALETNGSERARIDSAGRLLVGTSSARNAGGGFQTGVGPQFFIEQPSTGLTPATFLLNRDDSNGPRLIIGRSRGTALGSNTIVQSGDELGRLDFAGADGTDLETIAVQIRAQVDGTPGTNDMPGRLVFSTTADGASSPTERMRIRSNGSVLFGHTGDVGSTGMIAPLGYVGRAGTGGGSFTNVFNIAWTGSVADLWIDASNLGAIQVSSDYRIKQNVQTQTAPAIERIKLLRPITYELKDYESLFQADGVQREGFIAHEVQEVIPSGAEGQKDEENRVQSLRLDAIVSVLTKALQEAIAKIEALEAKVAALEA
jgi:hypothetical protein